MTDEREKLFRDLFAANLREQRKAKGISQKQLGLLCGFNEKSAENTIQNWEYKSYTPSAYNVSLLCQALNCKADDLIPKL